MQQQKTPPGGLEPPTFRLTAERASRLRHGGLLDSISENYFPEYLKNCSQRNFKEDVLRLND